MPIITVNLTDEACEAVAKFFTQPEGTPAAEFVQSKVVEQVTNWVKEQRNNEALAELAEMPVPNVEETEKK